MNTLKPAVIAFAAATALATLAHSQSREALIRLFTEPELPLSKPTDAERRIPNKEGTIPGKERR